MLNVQQIQFIKQSTNIKKFLNTSKLFIICKKSQNLNWISLDLLDILFEKSKLSRLD